MQGGCQTLKIDFGETAPAGGFFRVEVYGVTFPVEGGDEAFSGTYTLADGSTKKISKMPSVEIKGVTAFDNFLADLKEQRGSRVELQYVPSSVLEPGHFGPEPADRF